MPRTHVKAPEEPVIATCQNCGSKNVFHTGMISPNTNDIEELRCNDCHHFFPGRRIKPTFASLQNYAIAQLDSDERSLLEEIKEVAGEDIVKKIIVQFLKKYQDEKQAYKSNIVRKLLNTDVEGGVSVNAEAEDAQRPAGDL